MLILPGRRGLLGADWCKDPLWRRAGAVPSFDINPGGLGHVRDLITGTVLGGGAVNSATPAWDTGPDGILYQPAANSPVVGFDSVTLRPVGLRAWGITQNLNVYSDQLDNAFAWFDNGTRLQSNTVISPDGTQNADTLTTPNFIYILIPVAASTVYTGSCFVRLGTMSAADYKVAVYNQTAGSFLAVDVVVAQTPTSSGWTRVSYQFTTPAGCTSIRWYPFRNSSAATGATVHLYGSQVNPGPLAPYVPTTATAASSTADVIDITSLPVGINNIRTIYARVRTPASGIRGISSLNDNSSSNRLELLTNGTDPRAVAVTSGSTVADIDGGTIAADATFNIAARFDGNNYAVSINGAPVVTDNAGARAIVDRIFLGRTQAGEYLNGYIERLATWTTPISDARLQAIAS